ncbi:hypothetical protein P9281_27595 [Caballeronia sp. LP003]|uniref:hypothetical protein n=1 Tax=Caballeronia sp. LP003 TaxID=3038551 RepID=UPI0028679DF4|nr:hypothetical protein [Caballeronia sp. LP003]MDR5790315.1 hypothetical protein [Caballeronia sp. LP003]
MTINRKIIANEYALFAKANIPPDAGPGQHADMQRAFFGGVIVMQRINRLIGEMTDSEAVAILESIEDETNIYAVAQFVAASIFVKQESKS